MKFLTVALLVVTPLALAQETVPRGTQFPSNITIRHTTIDKVQAAFAHACSDEHGKIVTQTANVFECEVPENLNFAQKLIYLNAKTTFPERHYQWTFSSSNDDVNVQSSGWRTAQNKQGQNLREAGGDWDAGRLMAKVAKEFPDQ